MEEITAEVVGTDDSVEFAGTEDGTELDTGPTPKPDESREEGGVSMIERLSVPVGDPVKVVLTQKVGALDELSVELDDSSDEVVCS
jgi:hypothetical protein